jgi:hypothetical protein
MTTNPSGALGEESSRAKYDKCHPNLCRMQLFKDVEILIICHNVEMS